MHYRDDGVRVIRLQNIRFAAFDGTDEAFIAPEYYRQIGDHDVWPGDLLIAGLGDDRNPVGRACVAPRAICPAMVKADCFRFRIDQRLAISEYFAYQLSTVAAALNGALATGTTRSRMNLSETADRSVLVPSLDEQRAIAAFLDRETGRIDGLIAKKQRQIELLAEKRSALISHAVTKGLDPNVKMKDSGIEWLGQIPEHWEIVPLRHICESIQTGPFGSQLHQADYVPGGVPIVNPAHIMDGMILPNENSAVDEVTRTRLCRHVLQAGDVLFARRGEIGRCGLVSEPEAGWLCGTGCMRVRLSDVCSAYYNIVFNSRGFGEMLTLNAVGTTMLNINNTILARTLVPRPPRLEQEEIHAAIQRECGRVRQLTKHVERSIDLLREYRTALISAAVTGKIDVRGEVA